MDGQAGVLRLWVEGYDGTVRGGGDREGRGATGGQRGTEGDREMGGGEGMHWREGESGE